MRPHGFTLAEVIVALSLLSVVSAAVLRVLLVNRAAYDSQVARMEINATLRAAAAILPGELRELDPTDSGGGDLIRIAPSSLEYRAVRNLYVLCRDPVPSGGKVVLFDDYLGSRPVDPMVDSALIFAEGDPLTGADDWWVHADVSWTRAGRDCPGDMPSVTVGLAGVPVGTLRSVAAGAPFRSGAVNEMVRYRDGHGRWWLGMRRIRKSGRRPSLQPVLGPLAPGGLEFSYYDDVGVPTAARDQVTSIRVVVTAPPPFGQLDLHEGGIAQRRVTLLVSLRNSGGS